MKRRLLAGTALIFISFGSIMFGQEQDKSSLKYSAGIITGYNRGFGIQTNLTAYNFGPTFTAKLRFGIGLSLIDPGNAADARRIFINNATNGVPEKNGRSFDFRLDFMFPKTIFGDKNSYLVLAPGFPRSGVISIMLMGMKYLMLHQHNGEPEPVLKISLN